MISPLESRPREDIVMRTMEADGLFIENLARPFKPLLGGQRVPHKILDAPFLHRFAFGVQKQIAVRITVRFRATVHDVDETGGGITELVEQRKKVTLVNPRNAHVLRRIDRGPAAHGIYERLVDAQILEAAKAGAVIETGILLEAQKYHGRAKQSF